MTELEGAIDAIEHGVHPLSRGEEHPAKKIALSKRMQHYKVPGFSAAFVYQDELAWAKGFGVVEAGGEKPVTNETIFQAASISKSVTAMLALHLVTTGLASRFLGNGIRILNRRQPVYGPRLQTWRA